MIKILKNKFLICLFLLVTVFSVTSSCFAVDITTVVDSGYTEEQILQMFTSQGITIPDKYIIYVEGPYSATRISLFNDFAYLKKNSSDAYYSFYNSSNQKINVSGYYIDANKGSFDNSDVRTATWDILNITDSKIEAVSTITIYDANMNVMYAPEVLPDTSFTYEFDGVKRGQVKLTINNLDSSLKMYGYVGLNTTFSVGDTLDANTNIDNLRLMATRSDNSDLYCYVYEGEEINYYIVDENNIILDTGYISELAKGYFLYGFTVNNGVDFVFLKDGQVYWDNNLTFKYSVYGVESGNNNIVSAGVSSYIKSDSTVSSSEYIGKVYDSENNLICDAKAFSSNDLYSFNISVDTDYVEDNDFFNEAVWYIRNIYLTGTNSDGSQIDFSNYYIRWSVPTNLVVKEIKDDNGKCDKLNGIFYPINDTGIFSPRWSLRDYISDLKKDDPYVPFNITLQVYDGNDNIVLTHIINSDNMVEDKIASEENNVDKGDYGILDNPNYSGGSSSGKPNINNIQNWKVEDYTNLMSTDNFVWEFFKAILGNLPWWITTPLTILIFGVVIITLIRFARGA